MTAYVTRLRAAMRTYPAVLDAVVATTLLAAALVSLSGDLDPAPGFRSVEPITYLLVAVGIAPYYLRRRAPLAVLIAASIPVVALIALGITPGVLGAGLFLACYTVAAWSPRRHVVAGVVFTATLLVSVAVAWPTYMRPVQLAENLVLFGIAFALGDAARARRVTAEQLAVKTALLEENERELARRAVARERLAIAREVHDVVAHSLGVIAVQSGVGAHVIDTQPAEAKRALQAISTVSRNALDEVRGLLGMLRSDEDDVSYEPSVGLSALDALVDRTVAGGVPVTVHVEGEPGPLPLSVDLTAYRVVQEALTNVLRHAGDARVDVYLRHQPDQLTVEVLDDGPGVPGSSGSGHGLVGMRERVTAVGGTVEAGPLPGGGFRVCAVLPWRSAL